MQQNKIKVCVIGTGYVGLPTGVGLAELGYQVTCVDKDENKINALQNGQVTLFEDGLDELLHKNVSEGRIHFSSSMNEPVASADLIILAVGTPPHPITREADMQYINAAVQELASYLKNYTVIAVKSTVPVGTGDRVEKIIRERNPAADFDVISLPEFLREGFAVHDFFHPDRIVVGSDSERAKAVIQKLYEPFPDHPNILFVKRKSSEAIKYASNAFLAIKIHYINEMANFCEAVGADVLEVAKGMGLDTRIGPRFLNPGPGFGGSCFPKDTMAMAYMARMNGAIMTLVEDVIKENAVRKKQMAMRILEMVKDVEKPKICILGLAFKNGTDDCRESPAMEILDELLKNNVNIIVYDPKAMNNARKILADKVLYAPDMYSALKGTHVVAILTEWDEFKNLDLSKAYELMSDKKIIDCRNLLNPEKARQIGFKYQGIGR